MPLTANCLSKSFNPLVSIVIPVFNGSNFLNEAIDSAIAQTYKNIEIIVVNDGSNDEGHTEAIALGYGDKIRYFQKTNGGVATALNVAAKEVNGEYFSWLSHDDCYAPNKIEEQINYLTQLSELDRRKAIVYSDFSIFNTRVDHAIPVVTERVPAEEFTYWLATKSRLHGCSLLIPMRLIQVEGGFNEDLQTTQDYEFWFRLALKYEFHQLKKNLLYSRVHETQTSFVLSEIAKEEGIELHEFFLVQLASYNKKNNVSKEWEKYTKLTFTMLRKKYYRVFFCGLKFIALNFHLCTLRNKINIVIISVRELMILPLFLIVKAMPRDLNFFIKKQIIERVFK